MTKKYTIKQYEITLSNYEVEAESKEEAINQVLYVAGNAEFMGHEKHFEMVRSNEYGMPFDEADEEGIDVTKIKAIGNGLDENMIPSIAEIKEKQ